MTADPLARLAAREGVASAYAAARDGIDAVLRDRGLRRTLPDATAESLLRGAHASAAIEGSGSTVDEIRAGRSDPIAVDAVRLSTGLLALAPLMTSAPLQALAKMHLLAAHGTGVVGRPRDDEAAHRLREIASLVLAPSDAPALVLAAVVHAELATAAPFPSRNGLVARAAERLVLVARGVDAKSLTVPEAGHLASGPGYAAALARYREGSVAGVDRWLHYAAEAYVAGAEASPVSHASGIRSVGPDAAADT